MSSLDKPKVEPLLKWTKIELEETEDEISEILGHSPHRILRKESYFSSENPSSISSMQDSISRVFGTGKGKTVSRVTISGPNPGASHRRPSGQRVKTYRKYSSEQFSSSSSLGDKEMKIYWLGSGSDALDSVGDSTDLDSGHTSLNSSSGIDSGSSGESGTKETGSESTGSDSTDETTRNSSSFDDHTYQNVQQVLTKAHLIEKWIQSQSGISSNHSRDKLRRNISETTATTIESFSSGSKADSSKFSKKSSKSNSTLPVEYRCAICLDMYRDPRYLPCGHTYCKGCINSVVSSSSQDCKRKKCFTCPSCRNIIKYGVEGIKALPKNTNLDNAVKKFKRLPNRKKSDALCILHKEKREKTTWCESCSETICELCKEGKHATHSTIPLNTMKQFQHIRKKLTKTRTDLKSKHTGLKVSIDGIEKTRDQLDVKKAEIKKKIDTECNAMIEMIEKQRKQMYQDMDSVIAKKQKRKQREIANITGDLKNTKNMLETINDILDTEEPRSFLQKLKTSHLSSDFSHRNNAIRV